MQLSPGVFPQGDSCRTPLGRKGGGGLVSHSRHTPPQSSSVCAHSHWSVLAQASPGITQHGNKERSARQGGVPGRPGLNTPREKLGVRFLLQQQAGHHPILLSLSYLS